MSQLPLSPPPEPSPAPAQPVPLDSASRTTPIHAHLPYIRVPSEPLPSYRYHPVTCTPLEAADVHAQLQHLRKEYPTSVAALKAQEEAARDIKQRIEDAEKKSDELQKLMKRKTEERDMERRVFSKFKKEKEDKDGKDGKA